MARIVSRCEAKSQLSSLVEDAAEGRDVIIAKAGVPCAKLVSVCASAVRRPGGSKGRIWVAADFDVQLPPGVLAGFAGRRR
jgi:prevent-host-death family protein